MAATFCVLPHVIHVNFDAQTSGSIFVQLISTGEIKGQKSLEFGCGPCINTVIPASRCFDEVYMGEYAAQNRQAVQDWIDKKPSAHDWTPFLKFTAEKEGDGLVCRSQCDVWFPLSTSTSIRTSTMVYSHLTCVDI